MKRIIIFLLIGSMVLSCGSKKRVVTKKDKRTTRTEKVVIKPKTNTDRRHVYLMESDSGKGPKYYKIGISNNPEKRCKDIGRHMPLRPSGFGPSITGQ